MLDGDEKTDVSEPTLQESKQKSASRISIFLKNILFLYLYPSYRFFFKTYTFSNIKISAIDLAKLLRNGINHTIPITDLRLKKKVLRSTRSAFNHYAVSKVISDIFAESFCLIIISSILFGSCVLAYKNVSIIPYKNIDFLPTSMLIGIVELTAFSVFGILIVPIITIINHYTKKHFFFGESIKQKMIDAAMFSIIFASTSAALFFIWKAVSISSGQWVSIHGVSNRIPQYLVHMFIYAEIPVYSAIPIIFASLSFGGKINDYFFQKHQPEKMLMIRLSEVIEALQFDADKWPDFSYRRKIYLKIQSVAFISDSAFNHHFRTTRGSGEPEITKIAQKISNHFLSISQWLITPRTDTRVHLLKTLTTTLAAIALGDWDSIASDASEPNVPIGKWGKMASMLAFCRGTMVGLLPLIGFIAYQHWKPHAKIPDFLFTTAVGWAIVNMLLVLDPDLSKRISVFKDSLPFISGSGRTKSD